MRRAGQPFCPLRGDAPCMGAACALSRHTVERGGMWLFTCALPASAEGLPVIDRRGRADDPHERVVAR